jgi:S-adenosylmethionine decarboxylase
MNFYNIYYVDDDQERQQYIDYINCNYSADNLTKVLRKVTKMIGANILNIAKQDYDPQGASVNLLISEGQIPVIKIDDSCNGGNIIPNNGHILGHLDKSHISVHTYPENNNIDNICVVRADIEISTCGEISPLEVIDYLIEEFNSDMVTLDYKVRGFTRDIRGKKLYNDREIRSIQDFISGKNKSGYELLDFDLPQENIYYTKMRKNESEIGKHLFNVEGQNLQEEQVEHITKKIKDEVNAIFYGQE